MTVPATEGHLVSVNMLEPNLRVTASARSVMDSIVSRRGRTLTHTHTRCREAMLNSSFVRALTAVELVRRMKFKCIAACVFIH